MSEPTQQDVDALYGRLNSQAEGSGYHLNPDIAFTKSLLSALLINEARYGYMACPCRLASRDRQQDLDIICPCDYRDPDLGEYGCCYCALYVVKDIADGKRQAQPIPERRPPRSQRENKAQPQRALDALPLPVWRCKVCGYLCARGDPPDQCPICKASRERFERFI
jgi:ferredoxin-thioredoxin reductase catalytic chain